MITSMTCKICIFCILLFIPSFSDAFIEGPYTGRVIDGQTGEAIEGASVLCYWVKSTPNFEGGHEELAETRLVYTDKKGNYEIPRIFVNIGLIAILDSTNIIIYQPGYQVYIVKIEPRNPYSKPDTNFKKKDSVVKLDRIPPNFSHKEHYEKIDHALWGMDEYPYVYPQPQDKWMTWNKLIEMNLRGIPDKEEFLRRVEWEERRGMMEDRR